MDGHALYGLLSVRMMLRISKGFRFYSSRIASVERCNRMLRIKWEDGIEGDFPLIWLRDCSPDAATYTFSPAMTARNLIMRTFDVEAEARDIQTRGDNLHITWDDHTNSRYDSEWLRRRNPSCPRAAETRQQNYLFPTRTWNNQDIRQRLVSVPYKDFLNDDKALHSFLEAVCLDGIALLRGREERDKGAIEEIGERIGYIHRTHFGKVFQVTTKDTASNMAYANRGELPFHTDFPSLSDPPQLQMLHMVQRSPEGGNSLFVDGFHVAEQLRKEHPKAFEILNRLDCEYIEEGFDEHDDEGATKTFPYYMTARHHVIKTDRKGRVVRIQFGNAMRSWFYDCDPNEIQELYRAMKLFTEYCYRTENVLELALQNGDTVLWANTRLLHTRTSYIDSPGQRRCLTGCYFSWDIVKSKVRHLRRKLELPSAQPSA